MTLKSFRHAAMALSIITLNSSLVPTAHAEDQWPSRPINLVVGFAPGGPNDLVARVLAQRLSLQFKRQFVVDNRPGANGNIAAAHVAASVADGYTLLYNSSSLALSRAIYRNLPFDPQRDLAPVNGVATLPLVLVVNSASPIQSFSDWRKQVGANPGKFNYGSPGVGNLAHVGMEMILKANDLYATHIPYKGSSEAQSALLGQSIQYQLDSVNSTLNLIKAGKLRPLVVTSQQRSGVLPDVPTLEEVGVHGIELSGWQGVMAPAKTSADVLQKLSIEISRAMDSPEMRSTLAAQGAYPIASTSSQYGEFLADQIELFKKAVDQIGLKMD